MLGLDAEASDPDAHDNHRPAHHCLGSEAVDQVPILFGFKGLANTKAIDVVHLDLAEVQRDAHGKKHEPETNESDAGLGVYGFHEVLCADLISNHRGS